MQRAYINALNELAAEDPRVVSVLADNGTDYDWLFQRDYPDRFFNVGIAEQNMVALGAGLSTCGFVPFVLTAGSFLAYRAYEFIRDDVCFPHRNVKLVASGSGMSIANLGFTHHTTEDLACLRALPNLVILSPATPLEAAACVRLAYTHQGPVYIRLGMSGEKEFFEQTPAVRIGGSAKLRDGTDVTLFVTGSILEEVMKAADLLHEQHITCAVYDMYSVKPLDQERILNAAASCRIAVAVEEHNVLGGLGGAISEVLSGVGCSTPLLRIGLHDCFAAGYGTQLEVRKMNGLDSESIVQKVLSFFQTEKNEFAEN